MTRQFSVGILRLRNPDLSQRYRDNADFMDYWNSLSIAQHRSLHRAYHRRRVEQPATRRSARAGGVNVLSLPVGPTFDPLNINNILGNSFSKKMTSFKRGLIELLPLLCHNPSRPIFHLNSEYNSSNALLFLSTLLVDLTPSIEFSINNIKLKYRELSPVIDPLTALPNLYEKVSSQFFRTEQNFLYTRSLNLTLEEFQLSLSSIASNLGKLSPTSIKIILVVLDSGLSGINPNEDLVNNIDELLAQPISNQSLINYAFEQLTSVLSSEYLCICHAQGFKDNDSLIAHAKKFHKNLINEEVIARQMDRVTFQQIQEVERAHSTNHPDCDICCGIDNL